MPMRTRQGIALCKIIMATIKVDLAPKNPFSFIIKHKWTMQLNEDGIYIHVLFMSAFFDDRLSRYKRLKTLQQHKSTLKCP